MQNGKQETLTQPAFRHIYISPGHNFRGHHGREPDEFPMLEVDSVECVAGKGLKGDRYFGQEENFKGQITFFAWEIYRALCDKLGVHDKPPSALRRNIITEGLDLRALVGKEFEVQGVRFLGTEECKPCYWMDRAVGKGAEDFLQGRGGLRARILTDGVLRRTVPELFGLVLVGGRSTRMGRDKAALRYGDKPQAEAAYDLLTPHCRQVFLSCRRDQTAPAGLPQIVDVQDSLGPMAGIISALQTHPDKAWLVLACDLPFLTGDTLRHLIAHRDPTAPATAYRSAHDGKPEPLCAIYEPAIAPRLPGYDCPRRALTEIGAHLLDLPDSRALDNVNQPDEVAQARAALGKP